ncbi:hypothetical protein CEXT_148121 [Caerostris extrusa]|uniref:Uncharacterized protein n=1 Tax=Caerostris extrusa TaxID=172846 RepID=A0AAV4SA96_CAEEX|nr:hypothetical protein CEXT_148121 [Caerostris extrusa]
MYRDFGKFCRRTNAKCDKPFHPNPPPLYLFPFPIEYGNVISQERQTEMSVITRPCFTPTTPIQNEPNLRSLFKKEENS